MTFSKYVTVRFKCHGLFDQIFTPANFGNNAEQVTFRIFWPFVNFPLTFWFTFPFRYDSKVLSESKPFKLENMLLLLFLIFTPASVRSDWASNNEAASNPDDLIEKGILFNEVSKILLTEKFIRVEFLVPFPTYDFTMKPDIEKMIQQLSLMYETPSLFCPLNFSNQFATNISGFGYYIRLTMKFQQRN